VTSTHTVSDAHAKEYWRYLRIWQQKLGLTDWRITQGPDDKNASFMAAMSKWDWVQRQVMATLGRKWKSSPVTPHTLEQTAVHELLHVALYELIETARKPGVSDEDLASIEHAVINKLEVLLVPGAGQQ
jgi:hypothetical protein